MERPNPPLWSSRDWLSLSVCWAAFGALVARFWFLTDDAFISFRYSRNLALGHGLRFNLGEHVPVEGFSNLLWVLICAGIEWLEADIELWPNVLSTACGALLVALVYRTLRLRLGLPTLAALLGGLTLAAFPPVAVWSTGGLATMPFALLLFVAFERLVLRPGGIHGPSAGLACAALTLVRVEGAYWVVALLLMAAVVRRREGERLGAGIAIATAIFAATFVGLAVWRNAYYGVMVANTVSAKGGFSLARLGRGLDYVMGWHLTMLVPWLLLPAGVVAWRRPERGVLQPILAMALAGIAYSILVSGDYMTFGRFLVPFWSFNALLFGVLWHALGRRWPRLVPPAALATVAVGLLPGWNHHLVPHSIRERFHFRHNTPRHASEYEQWVSQKHYAQQWASRGRAFKRWLQPGSSIVLNSGIGAIGYYSELFIYDRGGLVTRETVDRPRLAERLNSPGHDVKKPAKFFLRYLPDSMNARMVQGPGVAKEIQASRKKLRACGKQATEHYVVDFRPLPDWEAPPRDTYFVYWRRLTPGERQKAERAKVDQRVADLARDIDPYRDAVMEGYPVPRWYRPELEDA